VARRKAGRAGETNPKDYRKRGQNGRREKESLDGVQRICPLLLRRVFTRGKGDTNKNGHEKKSRRRRGEYPRRALQGEKKKLSLVLRGTKLRQHRGRKKE